MEILLDNKNGTPIYDQIYTQIKDQCTLLTQLYKLYIISIYS